MKKLKNLNLTGIQNLAQELAVTYTNKDIIIGLIGPLGAGKTTFTKSFAKKLGIKKVKSPTFIIYSVYKFKNKKLYHYDFYRLEEEKQLEHIGFNETLNSRNRIVLIEWIEKFPKIENKCDLVIKFEILDKNLRNVTLL